MVDSLNMLLERKAYIKGRKNEREKNVAGVRRGHAFPGVSDVL